MQATKKQSEQELEDGLPDLRHEGAEGLFEKPQRTGPSFRKGRHKGEKLENAEKDAQEAKKTVEDEETANEDQGMEECVLTTFPKRLEPLSLTEMDSPDISVELNEAVLAPYTKGSRPYRPSAPGTQSEGDWWPARVIAYIPPPARRRRSQPIVKGSYRLRYMDGIEKAFTSREHFCTIHDRDFGKHPVRYKFSSFLLFWCSLDDLA
jgi:hypothetical protein